MATTKEDEKRLAGLKAEADDLGVEYSSKIGAETLEKRIKEAKAEKKKAETAKPQVLSPQKLAIMKAKDLKKVRVVNVDPQNSEATTVFASVHNQFFDLQRIVPLDMDIALEQSLIDSIELYQYAGAVPELNDKGKKTGNTTMKMMPKYQVIRL